MFMPRDFGNQQIGAINLIYHIYCIHRYAFALHWQSWPMIHYCIPIIPLKGILFSYIFEMDRLAGWVLRSLWSRRRCPVQYFDLLNLAKMFYLEDIILCVFDFYSWKIVWNELTIYPKAYSLLMNQRYTTIATGTIIDDFYLAILKKRLLTLLLCNRKEIILTLD